MRLFAGLVASFATLVLGRLADASQEPQDEVLAMGLDQKYTILYPLYSAN